MSGLVLPLVIALRHSRDEVHHSIRRRGHEGKVGQFARLKRAPDSGRIRLHKLRVRGDLYCLYDRPT